MNIKYERSIGTEPTTEDLTQGVWVDEQRQNAWVVSVVENNFILVCLNERNSYNNCGQGFSSIENMWRSIGHLFKGVIPSEHATVTLDLSKMKMGESGLV